MAKSLFDLTDEELEEQFRQAKAELESADEMEEFSETEEVPDDDSTAEVEDQEEYDTVSDSDDGLEQPEEDSDHNEEQEDIDTADEEQDSESEESDVTDNADTDSEEKDADSEEANKESPAESTKKVKVKANGQEFEFDVEEVLEKFPQVFGQAMDYTKKMQAIKPWRRTIDALEQAGLSHDDVNLMIDVLKGDKDAIAEVLKKNELNVLDLDLDEANYVPKEYGRNESAIVLDEVIQEISRDPEFETTRSILTGQWDDQSVAVLAEQPELIKALHVDVQNGTFNQIAPLAAKLKVYDGGRRSDLEYYKEAATEYFKAQQAQQVPPVVQDVVNRLQQPVRQEQPAQAKRIEAAKQAEASRKATKAASAKRKAAAPTRSKAGKSSPTDYLDTSDEAFEEWYRKIMDR